MEKQRKINIFFWCCKPLGVRTLSYLIALINQHYAQTHQICGVGIHSEDKFAAQIKEIAETHHIPVFDQNILKEAALFPKVKIGLIIGYPQKIPAEIIHRFSQGIINLHFAPLPHYRGSGTLPQAIINQEHEYGVTLHYIDPEIDTGPIIAVKMAALDNTKATLELIPQFEQLAYDLFMEWIEKILISDRLPTTDQTELAKQLSITPQLCTKKTTQQLYQLSLDWPFEKLHRYLRALSVGKKEKPYVEQHGRKIFLTLE